MDCGASFHDFSGIAVDNIQLNVWDHAGFDQVPEDCPGPHGRELARVTHKKELGFFRVNPPENVAKQVRGNHGRLVNNDQIHTPGVALVDRKDEFSILNSGPKGRMNS